jgi:hypothetical protein
MKGETGPSTDQTRGWVGQTYSLEDTEKKILSPLSGIKPPFLDQPAIHFASILS